MKKSLLIWVLLLATKVFAQDVIVKNDGTIIKSKILEVGTTEVRYKKFNNLDGPVYSLRKSDILSLNYENGDTDSFQDKEVDSNQNDSKHEEFVLNAGTNIPVQNIRYIRAADVDEGDFVDFKVSRDIKVKGTVVIPFGTLVKGEVYRANRSSWFGTKGKLGIRLNHILMPDGTVIPLANGDIYVTGRNRTPLSVCLFLFVAWPCCFITGSKAVLPADYEIIARVSAPVSFRYEDGELISKINEEYLDNDKRTIENVPKETKEAEPPKAEKKYPSPYRATIKIKDGDEIEAFVISEDEKFVNYKKLSKLNSSTYYQIEKINIMSIEKW